jgi:hypothetical protein
MNVHSDTSNGTDKHQIAPEQPPTLIEIFQIQSRALVLLVDLGSAYNDELEALRTSEQSMLAMYNKSYNEESKGMLEASRDKQLAQQAHDKRVDIEQELRAIARRLAEYGR